MLNRIADASLFKVSIDPISDHGADPFDFLLAIDAPIEHPRLLGQARGFHAPGCRKQMGVEVARIIFGRAMVTRLQRKAKTLDQAMRDIKDQIPSLWVIKLVRQRDGEVSAHSAVAASLCRFCSGPEALWVIGPCWRTKWCQATRLDDACPTPVVVAST